MVLTDLTKLVLTGFVGMLYYYIDIGACYIDIGACSFRFWWGRASVFNPDYLYCEGSGYASLLA